MAGIKRTMDPARPDSPHTLAGLEIAMARIALILASLVVCLSSAVSAEWALLHEETFDFKEELRDRQTFGDDGWLSVRLRGKGAKITVRDGAAHFQTPDFRDSALIRLTKSLPDEYRLRAKVGRVDYDISNYERPDDFDAPEFKYEWPKYIENGFYWLTLTDRLVQPNSGEEFWHRFRKVVIDSDDHVGVPKPVYMAYMDPEPDPKYDREKAEPAWIKGVPGMLRCWDGKNWHTSRWNWEVAFNYEDTEWYSVEIEKTDCHLIMRAYDSSGKLIPGMETTPVALDKIFGMGENATKHEWAYIGEPHVDSYEGEAWVDEICLWVRKEPK